MRIWDMVSTFDRFRQERGDHQATEILRSESAFYAATPSVPSIWVSSVNTSAGNTGGEPSEGAHEGRYLSKTRGFVKFDSVGFLRYYPQ